MSIMASKEINGDDDGHNLVVVWTGSGCKRTLDPSTGYTQGHPFCLWLNWNWKASLHIIFYQLYEMVQISQHGDSFSHLCNSWRDQNEIICLKGHYKLYTSRHVRECCGYQIIRRVARTCDVTLGGRRKDSVLNDFFWQGQKLDNLSHSFGLNMVLSKIL